METEAEVGEGGGYRPRNAWNHQKLEEARRHGSLEAVRGSLP